MEWIPAAMHLTDWPDSLSSLWKQINGNLTDAGFYFIFSFTFIFSSLKYCSNWNSERATTFHMSKLSPSLEIDLSHDEANTISSSASKIDELFVSLQLGLNIRQGLTKWKSLFSYLMRYMSFSSKMKWFLWTFAEKVNCFGGASLTMSLRLKFYITTQKHFNSSS